MGFSKFEFPPIGLFRYIEGYFGLDSAEEASEGNCLDHWSRTHADLGAPFKLI